MRSVSKAALPEAPGIQERPLRDGKFRVYRLAEQA